MCFSYVMRIDRIISSAAVVKLNVQNRLKYGFFLAVSLSTFFFICGWPSSKLSTVLPVFSSLWHVRQNPPQCLVKARRLPFSFSKDVKILTYF